MKIIGAGFGRTGTTSLKAALDQLGFPTYHMVEVFKHPEHVASWTDAAAGKPVDWDFVFRGYEAAVDWPACNYYRELMARYPDAKVLLSVRDADKWYTSVAETLHAVHLATPWWSKYIPRIARTNGMIEAVVWQGAFQGRFLDRTYALDVYNRHIETVKREVPFDRLLVWNVNSGWGPICAFLGVPAPNEPFPHLNDSAEFKRIVARVRIAGWAVPLVAATVVLALGVFVLHFVR